MFKVLCPSEMAGTVYDIDLDDLARRGIRALILDLDNTLLGWDAIDIAPRMVHWVSEARARGFRLCIASNGLDTRVQKIARVLGVPAISKAVKPRKRPFRQALELLDAQPAEVAVVGDQIFTDILGGNRMDFYTILINPISPKELRTTQMVRHVERRVLSHFHKKGMLHDATMTVRHGGRSRR